MRSKQAGFSLLEILVAFAVLSLSLGVLLQIFSRAMETTVISQNYSLAITVAESQLNAVGVDLPLQPGTYNGTLDNAIDWNLHIDQYPTTLWLGDSPQLVPYQVTVVTSWRDGGRRRRVRLSTIRLGAP